MLAAFLFSLGESTCCRLWLTQASTKAGRAQPSNSLEKFQLVELAVSHERIPQALGPSRLFHCCSNSLEAEQSEELDGSRSQLQQRTPQRPRSCEHKDSSREPRSSEHKDWKLQKRCAAFRCRKWQGTPTRTGCLGQMSSRRCSLPMWRNARALCLKFSPTPVRQCRSADVSGCLHFISTFSL